MKEKKQYREIRTGKPEMSLWDKVKAGLESTAEYSKRTGRRVFVGGKRNYSKYSLEDLRKMHARGTTVRNPKVAAHVNLMHSKWYAANKHRFADVV